MNLTASDKNELARDIVKQLSGADESHECGQGDLRDQIDQATQELDTKTAHAFARVLVDALCEDTGDLRKLEALLIVGLAHPKVLDKHRISLSVEGRRLAVLLELVGAVDRSRAFLDVISKVLPDDKGINRDLAAIMRRTGKTDVLIDRYMERAQEEIDKGAPLQAIPWLQEVLLHDSSRRDVARMIGDLRFRESERKTFVAKRNRLVLIMFLISVVLTTIGAREKTIYDAYNRLPDADSGDIAIMRERLTRIDTMITDNKAWLGMFQAISDRNRLRRNIDVFEVRRAEKVRREREQYKQRKTMAEAARVSGLLHVRRSEYAKGLDDLKKSLELSPEQWEHREQVEVDIAALEQYLEQEQERQEPAPGSAREPAKVQAEQAQQQSRESS